MIIEFNKGWLQLLFLLLRIHVLNRSGFWMGSTMPAGMQAPLLIKSRPFQLPVCMQAVKRQCAKKMSHVHLCEQVGARGQDEQGAIFVSSLKRSSVDVSKLRVGKGSTGMHNPEARNIACHSALSLSAINN